MKARRPRLSRLAKGARSRPFSVATNSSGRNTAENRRSARALKAIAASSQPKWLTATPPGRNSQASNDRPSHTAAIDVSASPSASGKGCACADATSQRDTAHNSNGPGRASARLISSACSACVMR